MTGLGKYYLLEFIYRKSMKETIIYGNENVHMSGSIGFINWG